MASNILDLINKANRAIGYCESEWLQDCRMSYYKLIAEASDTEAYRLVRRLRSLGRYEITEMTETIREVDLAFKRLSSVSKSLVE